MDNIIVITQNLVLSSIKNLAKGIKPKSRTLIVSTQYVYDNERELIDTLLNCRCQYIDFADLITDKEGEKCDIEAFNPIKQGQDEFVYYDDIKTLKNALIVQRLLELYPCNNKIIVCDDLGIVETVWLDAGFKKVELQYYYSVPKEINVDENQKDIKSWLKKTLFGKIVSRVRNAMNAPLSVAWCEGKKYIFYGSLNRIGYRLKAEFKPASLFEKLRYKVDCSIINTQPKALHITTFHEGYHRIPDRKDLNVRIIQDGYLPSNYGSNTYYFYGLNTIFYTWDRMGQLAFERFNLPSEIMPIRKKLYLPPPNFPSKLRKIVCAASGSADWTAIKNRSDENKLLVAIGKVAALFPDIEFTYRCHPVMAQPWHEGVNAINRNAEYIQWLQLPNFHISSNIPIANQDGNTSLSFKRSSFEEDLKGADIVLGEHSVSMIDAGLKGIIFASVNVTGHRSYAKSLGELGFPICTSVDDIVSMIKNVNAEDFKRQYTQAVDNYNKMTDIE